MSVSEERLMAFADGELSGAERAEIEAALANDAALRERLAVHRRLRTRLSAAFDGVMDEPAPARLTAALSPPSAPEVVSLAERRRVRWAAREWGAIAASTVLGLVVGVGVMNARAPLIAADGGGLVARGALAHALDTQLAADEAGTVRIGLSFRARDGRYCRTFDLTQGGAAGLACRANEGWNVAMAVASAGGGEVRQAGAPAEILTAVEGMIAGEPLDGAGEERARADRWR